MGQPNMRLSPPNLDLRHIQDHFGFTFSRGALNRFSGGFSHPVFKPYASAGRFSSSAGNLLPRFQHGSKTWVRLFSLTPEQKPGPTPRYRDCTIAFRNCKSFLPKRNCRRTASTDTTRRQLTIRNEQIKLQENESTVGKTIPPPVALTSWPQSTPAQFYSCAEAYIAELAGILPRWGT